MTPEEQIIEMYNDRIKEVCVQRANIIRDYNKWVRMWNIKIAIPLVAIEFFSICGLWKHFPSFFGSIFLLSLLALVALYFRQSCVSECKDLTALCDQSIERLIHDRDEIKREMKKERGY